MPKLAGKHNICILRPFVATAQQQHHLLAFDGVVHPIASTDIYTQLPHAVTTKLVIAKIALLYAVASSHNGNFGRSVFEFAQPLGVYILIVSSNVLFDCVQVKFSFINE